MTSPAGGRAKNQTTLFPAVYFKITLMCSLFFQGHQTCKEQCTGTSGRCWEQCIHGPRSKGWPYLARLADQQVCLVPRLWSSGKSQKIWLPTPKNSTSPVLPFSRSCLSSRSRGRLDVFLDLRLFQRDTSLLCANPGSLEAHPFKQPIHYHSLSLLSHQIFRSFWWTIISTSRSP